MEEIREDTWIINLFIYLFMFCEKLILFQIKAALFYKAINFDKTSLVIAEETSNQ